MIQHTLAQSFTFCGKGLHTGLQIRATFLPAAEDTGIRLVRTDLDGQPEIQALATNVVATERGTVIANGNATVSTIEHAMAALMAHKIDNCRIELDAPEMPILDGSAFYIVNAIQKAGIIAQNKPRNYFEVKEEIHFEHQGSSLSILPADYFSAEVHIDFNSPILPAQSATLEHLDLFDQEIAEARTFVFVREIAPLLQHNLIKGGDLDNAIVIYDQPMPQENINRLCQLLGIPTIELSNLGFLNRKPLTSDNEPARHKLLDVIGDLALIGMPIKGKVIAHKPGHHFNTNVAKAILSNMQPNK
jgi:UDP-3-O-[3-hydroxymyristoyl] N-acetylglucosamine deacetylase/3-hydroxyacyl-[acyl-carrier-protein] dehydratase